MGNAINFILIAGTTNSPKSVKARDKTRDNGSYLDGISSDSHNMKKWVNKNQYWQLYNTVQNMRNLKKSTVLSEITEFAEQKESKECIRIYYTGHGESNTGNWCFKDGTVSLIEVIKTVRSVNEGCWIYIYADCCYR